MIKNEHLFIVNESVALLHKHGEHSAAENLGSIVKDELGTRARLSAQAAARPKGKRGGRPTRTYVIEVEPGGTWLLMGAKATCEKIKELLTEFGSNRTVPNPNSFAVALSTRGHWHAMVDTDNGTVSIVARQARDDELA